MKIGKYISELLFEKDFVILPLFGEFSTKYIPARFVPELKKVEKPSKIIAFSERRKNDDNVLSDYIAKKENINSEKAKSFITAFVKEMNETLKSGKSVELENVGKFSPGVGNSINFEPDKSINYLKDSLGMTSVKEPEKKAEDTPKPAPDKPSPAPAEKEPKKDISDKPSTDATKPADKKPDTDKPDERKQEQEKAGIKKPEPEKPLERKEPAPADKIPKPFERKDPVPADKAPGFKPADKKPVTPAATKPKDSQEASLSPALKWIAFIAIPLLVIIIIFALNFRYLLGTDAPESTSFFDRITGLFSKPEVADIPEPTIDYEDIVSPEPDIPEPEEERPAYEPESGRTVYHVVVGSFVEKHNAEIFAEDLRDQGAEKASLFEQARTGHYRVSYGFYYSMQEAERELERIKQNVSENAWILKR